MLDNPNIQRRAERRTTIPGEALLTISSNSRDNPIGIHPANSPVQRVRKKEVTLRIEGESIRVVELSHCRQSTIPFIAAIGLPVDSQRRQARKCRNDTVSIHLSNPVITRIRD